MANLRGAQRFPIPTIAEMQLIPFYDPDMDPKFEGKYLPHRVSGGILDDAQSPYGMWVTFKDGPWKSTEAVPGRGGKGLRYRAVMDLLAWTSEE